MAAAAAVCYHRSSMMMMEEEEEGEEEEEPRRRWRVIAGIPPKLWWSRCLRLRGPSGHPSSSFIRLKK